MAGVVCGKILRGLVRAGWLADKNIADALNSFQRKCPTFTSWEEERDHAQVRCLYRSLRQQDKLAFQLAAGNNASGTLQLHSLLPRNALQDEVINLWFDLLKVNNIQAVFNSVHKDSSCEEM